MRKSIYITALAVSVALSWSVGRNSGARQQANSDIQTINQAQQAQLLAETREAQAEEDENEANGLEDQCKATLAQTGR